MAYDVSKLVKLAALKALAEKVQSGYTTKEEVASLIAAAKHASFEKVDVIPTTANAKENVLYLVMNTETNHYDIYALVSGEVVLLDDTTVDLTDYSTTAEINTFLKSKVDKVDGMGLSSNDYTTTEKEKLSGIADGANNYTHPSHTAAASGLYKITVDELGHIDNATAAAKSDITALGIPAQDTTYEVASATTNGLMSSEDKSKLDTIDVATDAEVTDMLNEVFTS